MNPSLDSDLWFARTALVPPPIQDTSGLKTSSRVMPAGSMFLATTW